MMSYRNRRSVLTGRGVALMAGVLVTSHFPCPALAQTPYAETLLSPPMCTHDDKFGSGVALGPDLLLAGRPGVEAAYVFMRTGGNWAMAQELTASGGNMGDRFGASVAMQGDLIAVAAPLAAGKVDPGGAKAGAIYVFRSKVGVWSQEAVLAASDGLQGDYFAQFGSIAIYGDRVYAGAAGRSDGGVEHMGAAYAFAHQGGGIWKQEAKLVAKQPHKNALMGASVAAGKDLLLAGAYHERLHSSSDSRDAVHVFEHASGGWHETSVLYQDPDECHGDWAYSISLDGDTLAVGCPQPKANSAKAAAVSFFQRQTGGTWKKHGVILRDAEVLNGNQLALHKDVLAIVGGYNSPYKGFVFRREASGTWTRDGTIKPSDYCDKECNYGLWALSVYDGTVAVGAAYNDVCGTSSGRVYLYDPVQAGGKACAGGQQCKSGYCIDGVCCDSACGGGTASDCQACSKMAGGSVDGVCGAAKQGIPCRAAAGVCDAAEACDGTVLTCPADDPAKDGVACPGGVCSHGTCVAAGDTSPPETDQVHGAEQERGCGCQIGGIPATPAHHYGSLMLALALGVLLALGLKLKARRPGRSGGGP